MARGRPRAQQPQPIPPPADSVDADIKAQLPRLEVEAELDALDREFEEDRRAALRAFTTPVTQYRLWSTNPRNLEVEVEEEEDGGEEEEEEESDDENDERPPRSTNQRTLEERLRRELEYIDDLLEQDEDADQENLSVPPEQWRAADFVEEEMVYASIDVLILDALRYLQTVERNSTLRLYTSWIYHYKRWAAKMLRQIRNKLPQEYRLKHVDKIGHYIRDNKKKNWDQEADVPRAYVWLHGPRVTKSRLRAYVKYMVRELKLDAESSKEGDNATGTQPVQSTTVHTLLGRIKACQMAARVEATIYRETELSIMREISVVRSEVRFMIRTKNERDIKNCTDRRRGTIGDTYTAEQFRQIMFRVLPTWAAKAWNPRGTGPSQTLWRFLLLKVLTLLSHHSLLRGASIREITLPDIFLYRLASTSSVNPENQPVVMVIAARNSKTSKDVRLQQSYAARHLEAELCAVGETGLWLHFILDQIVQFHGVRLILPVDTSTRASWYKKHLFFAKNDTDQGELSAASHQRWTRQFWDKNGVFCKRNVHAARAGGAQELAIDGTPRAEIAELGHWALDKMTRAYITAIPVGVVMKKSGYSGYKQDYFLGRSRLEPSDKLLKLLAEHIFPGVDDMLKTAEGKAAKGSDADKAAVHFWRTLQMLRRIVAEDLAVKLVRTPWHPYVQGSLLCRIPLFQHWAKRVEALDTETINKRRDPTQIQAEEISVRMDTEYYSISLKAKLTKEMERAANEKIDFLEELEKRDDTIASLTAEITRLTEALRVSEARRVPEAPLCATAQAPSEGGSADSANMGAGADGGDDKPPPPPQTDEEASYELNVVQPWREAKAKLTKEMERAANEKIDFLEELKKRDDTIASLTAEITRLTEALRVSEARRVPEAPPCATAQAPSEGGSADSANMGAGADAGDDKPPPPPQTDEEASYELNVVQPWREAKTVRDAWRLWNSATANDTRRLCDRVAEPGFIDRHTLLNGATQGALKMRVRRMLKVMDAVRQLRASDGDADTEAVVDALHRIAAPGIGTFADALTVLKPGTAPMLSKEPGMGVKGLGPKVVSKLRLACALVALNLKQSDWVETMFPDTWEEQMPKTKADLAKPTAPAKSTAPAKPAAPVHRPPTKRKKSA
ncbi:unnamed protein product [Closterium sp. Naga37s-1]|nr:unnamed protein product [Closterium sp. Naga37s-1]